MEDFPPLLRIGAIGICELAWVLYRQQANAELRKNKNHLFSCSRVELVLSLTRN